MNYEITLQPFSYSELSLLCTRGTDGLHRFLSVCSSVVKLSLFGIRSLYLFAALYTYFSHGLIYLL